MCGICGIVEFDSSDPRTFEHVRAMNACLVHRGPDDEGNYSAPGVGLGVRRLSIIDVAGGAQPQSNENCPARGRATGAVHVVHNGEIYNYRSLRAELDARGHVFNTASDTEVTLHGYEEWGEGVFERLHGMFAIALWDEQNRRLLLGRDRFGKKPLLYALDRDRIAFASTATAILQAGIAARPDHAALAALFELGFIPSPRTAFQGIVNLPAAHYMVVENGHARLKRYWDISFPESGDESTEPWDTAVAGFRERLEQAVTARRVSQVPLGALLSGGIDSSSIVALLKPRVDFPLHTVSIGFDAPGYDEARFAQLAARHIGTEHHAFSFSFTDFDRLPEAIAHLEQPQCSATALPIYLLYEKCRAVGLTVVLTGEGSDELLGGYHWYRGDALARRLLHLPAPARKLAAALPLPMSEPARRVLAATPAPRDPVTRYALWQQVAARDQRESLLKTERNGHLPYDEWQAAFAAALRGRAPHHQLQYVEAHTRLVDFINLEVDRMSMAHSVEARAPFLDHALWEYAARLPARFKEKLTPEKRLLRVAMRRALPPEIVNRRKQGLAAPHRAWLARPRLPDWAEQMLTAQSLESTGYFDPGTVARLRREHVAGAADYSRVLMGVLTTQMWHARFCGTIA
jgi:asparagine synthase (glutamine-hydrolysing)